MPLHPKASSIIFPPGWCTYMLICIDGSYYVGLTNDLAQRIHDHSSGKGPSYTKGTTPRLLAWFESHPNRDAAAAREKQLKGWNRTKKHALARAELQLGPAAHNVWLSLG
jgi:putative endonuclease